MIRQTDEWMEGQTDSSLNDRQTDGWKDRLVDRDEWMY